MTISYTEEAKYPLLDDGGRNWGSVINGVLEDLDAGREVTLNAGETLKKHDLVCMKSTDGKMYKADCDDLTLSPPIGFVTTDTASGTDGKVRGFGWIDFEASWAVADSLSYAHGQLIYCDSTAGRISSNRPKNAIVIGKVKEDTDASFITKMFINPLEEKNKITQMVHVPVEDLSAGSDIATRPVLVAATAIELVAIGVLSQGTPAGVDDSNTAVIAIADDAANTIITKTYDTSNAFPTNDYEDLGVLDSTHKILDEGEHITLSVTNGATADLPSFIVVVEYILRC